MLKAGALTGVIIAGIAFVAFPAPKAAAITAVSLFSYAAGCLLVANQTKTAGHGFATTAQPLIPIIIRRPKQ